MLQKTGTVLVFCAILGCAGTHYANKALDGMPAQTPDQEIHVKARKYEFTPSEIHVRQGAHVILLLESEDVTHGFMIEHYRIDATIPAQGKVRVEFYAKDAGTYPFKCSHFCGMGHFGMKGVVVVEKTQ